MAKGINKVIIVGNLGQDPDTRAFPDGGSVTNISVATSETWRDKQSGNMQERTEWHRIVLRDRGNYRLGQIAAQYLRKGSKVYIEGSLRTRKWQDQQGADRYTTEIIANEMQMLDSRQEGVNNTPSSYQAPQQNFQNPTSSLSQPQANTPSPAAQFDDFDDDIPF